MAKNKRWVFYFLQVVAWLLFIGLSIEAVALLVNYIISLYNPDIIDRLYQKINLQSLFAESPLKYHIVYLALLLVSFGKAVLFYIIINLLMKLDWQKPFNEFAGKQILKMSGLTLMVGIVSIIGQKLGEKWLTEAPTFEKLNSFWKDGEAFLMMAAVIYSIAVIFNKGISLQQENDLTV